MAKIQERDLLKALNELEDLVEKGDALENQDTEGGLSTQGTPLSSKAPSGRSDTKKSDRMAKMLSASDTASDDDDEGSGDGASPDEQSDDDDGDSGEDTSKSFRQHADENDTMHKAIEISDFIAAMVDQTSDSLTDVQKSLTWVAENIGTRIEKSEAAQSNFNTRLAKAVVSIGNTVSGLAELVGQLAGQPNVPQRRAVLSKSEVVDPYLGGQPSGGDLGDVSKSQIQDWLFDKAGRNEIDPVMVTVFEQNGYNPEVLPVQIRKALINDLRK